MAEIIAVANAKGGVAKTTTVLALGRCWAKKGKKILLVDLDSQANLTSTTLPEDYEPERTIADAFISRASLPVLNVEKNVDMVPSGLSLSNFDNFTASFKSREFLLADLLEGVRDKYDYIIIDCPPTLGIITYEALVAANHLVMPASADRYSYDGMMMIAQIYNDVRGSQRLNPNLRLEGVIVTKYRINKISEAWLQKMKEELGDTLVEPVISEATKIQQAASFRRNIYDFDPQGKATLQYKEVAKEILKRVNR